MPKVKNSYMAGQLVMVEETPVLFDTDGLADVTEAQAAHLAQVPYYDAVEEVKPAKASKAAKADPAPVELAPVDPIPAEG